MVQLGAKVKPKNAEKWTSAITPHLVAGEEIWAFASPVRLKPMTSATVFTNARIIGFFHGDKENFPVQVWANEIRGVEFPGKFGSSSFRVTTDDGEVNFGNIHKDEIDFARFYADQLAQAGMPPAIHDALQNEQQASNELLQRRDSVPVIGSKMKESWWDAITSHSHPGELPWFVINNGIAGRFAAFEDRVLISKTGGMTSFAAGSLGGGRETVFPFNDITNIEYNGGMMNGVLEVLTPSYQGSNNHDYWSNDKNTSPYQLSNTLPIIKPLYKEAQPLINELMQKTIESKRPHVTVHTEQPAPAAPAAPSAAGSGLADQIARLADLHKQGLLDDDEFKAAKQAAINGVS